MKPFILIVICLAILGYMWRDQISEKLHETILAAPKKASEECVVNGNSCEDLVRMLNTFRPGRYYEGASQLVGVKSNDVELRRDGGAMVFTLPDGRTLIHNQGVTNLEKGYLTVIFEDGYWQKYNERGIFVEEGEE